MDITGRCCVLTTLDAGAELPLRNQPRDIVGTHEVLSHTDDGLIQRSLAVVVSSVLGHVSCKLGHSDLLSQITLEGCIEDLALRGLETIHYARDRALQIVVAEMDQVLVNKVIVRQLVASRNQGRPIVALEPFLAVIGSLLVEGQINGLV